MTVFRQAPFAPLLSTLRITWKQYGRPLGRVAYFGAGVRDYGGSLHILWLKGDN